MRFHKSNHDIITSHRPYPAPEVTSSFPLLCCYRHVHADSNVMVASSGLLMRNTVLSREATFETWTRTYSPVSSPRETRYWRQGHYIHQKNWSISFPQLAGFVPLQKRVLEFPRRDGLTSPRWPWYKLHCCSSKGSRRPISLMMTPTQYYARSEYHTKLVMSYEISSISQLGCFVFFYNIPSSILVAHAHCTANISARIYGQTISPPPDVWGTAPRRL